MLHGFCCHTKRNTRDPCNMIMVLHILSCERCCCINWRLATNHCLPKRDRAHHAALMRGPLVNWKGQIKDPPVHCLPGRSLLLAALDCGLQQQEIVGSTCAVLFNKEDTDMEGHCRIHSSICFLKFITQFGTLSISLGFILHADRSH